MERYTEKVDGIWVVSCKYEEPPYPVVTQEVIDRFAAIEDILGEEYDLDRLRELAQADREGRVEIIEPDVYECVKTVREARAALRREQDEQTKL